MEVKGRRRLGRSNTRWEDYMTVDMRENGLNTSMDNKRDRWKRLVRNTHPI